MFACVYLPDSNDSERKSLLNCAGAFSPVIEELEPGTVVFDISGSVRLFGSEAEIAARISRYALDLGLRPGIAIAPGPDSAIHVARGYPGISIVSSEHLPQFLGPLPLSVLAPALAGIDKEKAIEIDQTLHNWGIRTLGEFAALPEEGVSSRLGDEGVALQRLARGVSDRSLMACHPDLLFEESAEPEVPILSLEPLSFVLRGLIQTLCMELTRNSLSTNELDLCLELESLGSHQRSIRLPFPIRDHKTLLKLIELDLEQHPPKAAVSAIKLRAKPARPRTTQMGLFNPPVPHPEKLELTIARIARIVGPENIGSAQILDTHRPAAFAIRHFNVPRQEAQGARRFEGIHSNGKNTYRIGLRIFRPPIPIRVESRQGKPAFISPISRDSEQEINGPVVRSSGPWRSSGDWWTAAPWMRDEWDVELRDAGLYRIVHELASDQWLIEGNYD